MKLNLERIVIDLGIALASWLPIDRRMKKKMPLNLYAKITKHMYFVCILIEFSTKHRTYDEMCGICVLFFAVVAVVIVEKQQRKKNWIDENEYVRQRVVSAWALFRIQLWLCTSYASFI